MHAGMWLVTVVGLVLVGFSAVKLKKMKSYQFKNQRLESKRSFLKIFAAIGVLLLLAGLLHIL